MKEKIASLEAEQVTIGSVLLDESVGPKIFEICRSPEYFSQEKNQKIYAAYMEMHAAGQAIDVVTVGENLERAGALDAVGGMAYLGKIAEAVPSAKNAVAYARIVADYYQRRQIIRLAEGAIKSVSAVSAEGREAPGQIVAAMTDQLQSLIADDDPGVEIRSVSEILPDALAEIDRLFNAPGSLIGAATGYGALDQQLSGLQRGDMIVLAARPAMGKSALALNIADNFARRDERVLIFSLEMPGSHITRRLMSSVARIDQHRLRSGRLEDAEWPKIVDAAKKMQDMPIYVGDQAAPSIADMRAAAQRVLADGGLDLIIVDYLQLMDSGRHDYRALAIAEISRGLKLLAKEFDVPLLALSQLNRSLESRPNKRPLMADLRESGAIEQDADIILFIYRDVVYHPDTERPDLSEIIIAKQRNGPVGTVYLTFRSELMRFEDYQSTID